MSEKNYKMIICYDGSRYFGWEHQPDKETIQGKLEAVLSRMCDKGVDVTGAGRTDAGVHARAMCASVKMDTPLSPEEIKDYMNRFLPDDIAVREVRIASDQFHARYKAIGKTYRYTCYIGDSKPVFDRKYMAVLDFKPDISAMEKACGFLTGKHDYKSFCGNSHMKKSTVRIVDSIVINVKKDTLTITFHGTGFLQNMVRIMVGTLLRIAQGKIPPDGIPAIIDKKDRQCAGPTAQACGLYLNRVFY